MGVGGARVLRWDGRASNAQEGRRNKQSAQVGWRSKQSTGWMEKKKREREMDDDDDKIERNKR